MQKGCIMSNFPSKIKKLRIENGLTQKQIAESLNVSQNAIYNWENGKREPNLDMIKQIAKYFDFPLYLLLDDNYELGDIALEKKRARIIGDTEMTEPPKPFTVPLSSHNNYDGSIRVNPNPEREKLDEEAQKIIIKQASDEEITEEEAQKVSDYIERTREDYDKLSESIKNLAKVLDKYLNESTQISRENFQLLKEKLQILTDMIPTMPDFYENLNDIGRKKAAEQIDLLTKIPEYQKKPDELPEE